MVRLIHRFCYVEFCSLDTKAAFALILCYPLLAAYVACSLAPALHNTRRTSYFKKISLRCPYSICFPHVPKGQKAKQLVSFWYERGKSLAVKCESLLQHRTIELFRLERTLKLLRVLSVKSITINLTITKSTIKPCP